MFNRLLTLIGGLAVVGCNQSQTLSPQKFTETFAAEMRKAVPTLNVTIVAPLELRVKDATGHETTSFLDNAYRSYRMTPADGDAIIAQYVVSFKESRGAIDTPIDKTRIVPVIKDKNYLAGVRESLVARGQSAPDFMDLYEVYNSELWIFYAEDSPKNMRFLSKKDLAKLDLDTNSVRTLAVENLRKIVPQPEIMGGNGIYMLRAGGDYEASLLLADKLWTSGQFKVDGDIVVAVPSRDVVIITGSSNRAAIAKAREVATKTLAEAAYRLTPELFVYRNGKFEVFRE
jgi:uncharacterized protein YtpQ (UPF0354 family)